MAMGMTKFKKDNNRMVILDCKTRAEMKKLNAIAQRKLGDNFKIRESSQRKSKMKIINVGEKELKMDDNDFLDTVKKQNRIATISKGVYMKIKRVIKETTNSGKSGREDGSIIIEWMKRDMTRC